MALSRAAAARPTVHTPPTHTPTPPNRRLPFFEALHRRARAHRCRHQPPVDAVQGGPAAQHLVMHPFHPGPPDPHARQRQHRIILGIILRRRGDVADYMRQRRPEAIFPRGAHIHQHARQVRCVHLDASHILPGQEFAQNHRNKPPMPAQIALDPGTIMVGQHHHAGKIIQGRAHIGGLLGNQQRPPVQPVAGHHPPVAVQQPPARRRQQAQADAIVV